MKIGIEASILARERPTGVDYYALNLLRGLVELMPDDQFQLAYFGKRLPTTLMASNVALHHLPLIPRRWYNWLMLVAPVIPFDLLARTSTDIFIFPDFATWPLAHCENSIVVIPDLSHRDYPEVIANSRHRWFLDRAVHKSTHKASRIIAISNSTKNSLMRNYSVPADKITVINPAVDRERYQPASQNDINQTKQRLGITRDYILYLGTLEPRKNILGIVRSYRSLPEELRANYQLVLAGGRGWLSEDAWSEIIDPSIPGIVITGYVAEADTASIYSGATIFLYPSFYEGWGMQVLEAMACGVPVIAADNTSLPEAGGKAARYVDAADQTSINATLAAVLSSPKLQADMRKAGFEHVKSFSWEKSARQLCDLITEVVND